MPKPDHLVGDHIGALCACGVRKYRYSFRCRSCDDEVKKQRAFEKSVAPVREPSDLDIAWTAGLYEGEGCVQPSSKSSLQITVAQNERQILDWLVEMFGGGISQSKPVPRKHGGWTTGIFVWNLTGIRAFQFADKITPYLSDRRKVQMEKARRGR